MMKAIGIALLVSIFSVPAFAQDVPAPARKPLEARAELNVRGGSERSILMNEFWVPLTQTDGSVLYGDIRLMGDDQENREFNVGAGYRRIVNDVPVLGDGVAGGHLWFDRRITDRGSRFNQITAGAEWSGDVIDLKLNGYLPLSDDKTYITGTPGGGSSLFLNGSGIYYRTLGGTAIIEEPQPGIDVELGFNVNGIIGDFADSTRVYAGAYHFMGDKTDNVTGWRTRIASDITEDFQVGARFQRDDERGSQSFLEATIRFPFGNKKSYREHGLYARLDESPERDIDIVTGSAQTITPSVIAPVINTQSGQAQRILYVDNTAAGGGTGSKDNPFNTLAAAEAAMADNDVIYIARGNGTSANMNAGITLNRPGVSLIGSGSAFVFDGSKFSAGGSNLGGTVLIPQGAAPIITNATLNGDGIRIAADNISLSGLTISNASRDGVNVDANNLSASNITIRDITTSNNGRMGIYLHGYNNGTLSAMVERTATSGNAQHGIAVYDDTAGAFDVDLGGGQFASQGRNRLAGNTLEDLALDYDGRVISAMNNWWGQASGPDQNAPNVGVRPQIYYGAPINDGLVGHWTFDSQWINGTTIYDRSGRGYNGTLTGGTHVAGPHREAIYFDGASFVVITPPGGSALELTRGTLTAHLQTTNAGTGYRGIVQKSNSFGMYTSNNNFAAYDPGTGLLRNSGVNIGDGVNHFTAQTFDSGVVNGSRFFLEGAPGGTFTGTQTIQTGNISIARGQGGGTQLLTGVIDDVRIYNRTLTNGEIAELYRMDSASTVNFSGFLNAAP